MDRGLDLVPCSLGNRFRTIGSLEETVTVQVVIYERILFSADITLKNLFLCADF